MSLLTLLQVVVALCSKVESACPLVQLSPIRLDNGNQKCVGKSTSNLLVVLSFLRVKTLPKRSNLCLSIMY